MVQWFMRSEHRKRIQLITGTIVPVYTMLTVLMPGGFAGVYWMMLVVVVFIVLFVLVLTFEKSPVWNGLIAFIFWMPMVAIHLYRPGTAAIEEGTVYVGVIEILRIGLVHAVIQSLLRLGVNQLD